MGIELLPPDQTTLTTPVNDRLKEAPEDLDAVTFPNAGQAGMVGQWLVQVVAQRGAYTQTVSSDAFKLALARTGMALVKSKNGLAQTGSITTGAR